MVYYIHAIQAKYLFIELNDILFCFIYWEPRLNILLSPKDQMYSTKHSVSREKISSYIL